MPVNFLSESSQERVLNEANESKKRYEKIPLVPRNANSGWPLLQVSLFSPNSENSNQYEHALGGGKCHYFHIGAFNIACLLAKLPGKMNIIGNYNEKRERERTP